MDTGCEVPSSAATDQMNTGDMLLIDRHPGDQGLSFLRETQPAPGLAETLLAASNSSRVSYTEARF